MNKLAGVYITINSHYHRLVNHQNTQLSEETEKQASNRDIMRVLGRLYSLILSG